MDLRRIDHKKSGAKYSQNVSQEAGVERGEYAKMERSAAEQAQTDFSVDEGTLKQLCRYHADPGGTTIYIPNVRYSSDKKSCHLP